MLTARRPAQSRQVHDEQVPARGDGNIKSNANLITKATFYQDPNFPDRKEMREATERQVVLDTPVRLQGRFAVQSIVLSCTMRALISITVATLLMTTAGTAVQVQTRDVSAQELAQSFASPSLPVRMEAAATAWKTISLGHGRELLSDRNFQNALFDLLRRENEDHVLRFQGERFAATLGEGWSESYAGILGIAMQVVPLLSPEKQRDWLKELVRGSYNPVSGFATWLAGHGDLDIDALLDLTRTAAIQPQRENAYAVLAEMVGLSAFKPRASLPYLTALSFANRQRALTAIDEGLHHQESSIPRQIVITLGRHASPEILTILQSFDRGSRGQPGYSGRAGHNLSLQAEVEKATAKVQAGLGQEGRPVSR